MDVSNDGGETPRKSQAAKHPVVQSPSGETGAPPTRRQRTGTTPDENPVCPHSFPGIRLTNNNYSCSVGHASAVGRRNVCPSLAVRGTGRHATTALWGRSNASHLLHGQCSHLLLLTPHPFPNKTGRGLPLQVRHLPYLLSYGAEMLPIRSAVTEDIAPALEALRAGQEELRDMLHNIDTMLRAMCIRNGVVPSNLNLRIPAVPPFNSPGPTQSSTSSATSTISSVSSGVPGIERMSLGGPQGVGPSGSGSEHVQVAHSESSFVIKHVLCNACRTPL